MKKANHTSHRRRPQLESLETRTLLACTISPMSSQGVVTIRGTDEADNVYLAVVDNGQNLRIQHRSSGESRATTTIRSLNGLQRIVFYGYGGDDRLTHGYSSSGSATNPIPQIYAHGHAGKDTLSGGGQDDKLYGGSTSEADVLRGFQGHDELYGGPGNDSLGGDSGNDRLFGEAGDYDKLNGGIGSDFLDPGSADETTASGGGSEPDFDAWHPVKQGVTYKDVKQRDGVGDCQLESAMAAVAASGQHNLEGRISYLGNRQYAVKLYHPTTRALLTIEVFFNGYVRPDDPGIPAYSKEFWTILVKRAYEQMPRSATYLAGVEAPEALRVLTGKGITQWRAPIDGPNETYENLKAAVQADKSIVIGTLPADISPYLHTLHAYAVVGLDSTGKFILRNPWGIDGGSRISGIDDGTITLSWSELRRSLWYCWLA